MVIRRVMRRLRRSEPLMLVDRGQSFFPVDLATLLNEPRDSDALAWVFEGAALIARSGQPPSGQLLQDAFAVGVVQATRAPRTYLEIGGGPPVDHSNTEALDRLGWRGVVVEPNPHFADQYGEARSHHTKVRRVAVATGSRESGQMTLVVAGELSYVEGFAPPPDDVWKPLRDRARKQGDTITVDVIAPEALWAEVVAALGVPSYLSIDVEGGELKILERLPLASQRPTVITAETSLDLERAQAMDRILEPLGYQRFLRVGAQWDNWYVAQERLELLASGHGSQ